MAMTFHYATSIICILYLTSPQTGLLVNALSASVNRREALSRGRIAAIATASAATSGVIFPLPAASAAASSISNRLDNDSLTIPAPSQSSELQGVDNLYFPDWMAGEWSVTQTLVDIKTPLGLKFIGGPNADINIATKSFDEARERYGVGVSLKLRFLPTKWGVAEDRLYNTKQRLDSFAGKSVVSTVEYNNVGGSNRPSVMALGGTEEDPLQTTTVRFKGPAAQKTFVVSHGTQYSPCLDDTTTSNNISGKEQNCWSGYELDRSIFALTNQNSAPPITTDAENIWSLRQISENHVEGKLRIAGYLNAQSDVLYFDARKRAVSLQDYTLDFRR